MSIINKPLDKFVNVEALMKDAQHIRSLVPCYCDYCGREDFKSWHGVKIHVVKAHYEEAKSPTKVTRRKKSK